MNTRFFCFARAKNIKGIREISIATVGVGSAREDAVERDRHGRRARGRAAKSRGAAADQPRSQATTRAWPVRRGGREKPKTVLTLHGRALLGTRVTGGVQPGAQLFYENVRERRARVCVFVRA